MAFSTLTLPDAVSGFVDKGACKITLTNQSNAGFTSGDKATLTVVLRPDGAADASTDRVIGTLANQGVGIAVGSSKQFSVALTVPADTPIGDYSVMAFAKSVDGATELAQTTTSNLFEVDAQVLDLEAALGTITVPAAVISGSGVSGKVQVKIVNDGNIKTSPTEKVRIQIIARPSGGGSDIVLTTLDNQALANLAPGKFKLFNVTTTFPINVSTGSYDLGAVITDLGPTTEAGSSNNTAIGSTIAVTQGFVDLSTSFGKVTLPPSVVAGTTVNGAVQVKVSNAGNISTPKTETADITLVLHPHAGGSDLVLKVAGGVAVGNVKPGITKIFTYPVSLSGTLSSDTYDIVAAALDTRAGADGNGANDSATFATSLTIAPAFVDLTVDNATSTLSGSVVGGTTGKATVTLKNLGNVPSTGYLVEVFATSSGTISGGDSPIGSLTSASAKINAGGTLAVPVNITIPNVASSSSLTLVARVTLAGDTQATNNTHTAGVITATPIPPILGNLPTQMTFTQTQFIAGPAPLNMDTETGTLNFVGFTSGDGYSYITSDTPGLTKQATFHLGISPYGIMGMTLTFFGTRPRSISGKTMTLQTSSSGATGKLDTLVDYPLAGIMTRTVVYFVLT